jgi:transposase
MSKLREVLRLKSTTELSHRAIAASLSISAGAVSILFRLLRDKDLSWPLPPELDDEALEQLVYGVRVHAPSPTRKHEPPYREVHEQLKRKGVTLQLLWQEYRASTPEAERYQYSQFCELYRRWRKTQSLSMRQTHIAGDKLFIDYAGMTVPIIDPNSGEIHAAQLFVATLGYSKYTYAEVTRTQTLPDWIGAHVRALQFFGGVPQLLVPDNLKSAVKMACRYEPDDNPTYAHLVQHYGVAVLPARPRKPKDKAIVENAVLIAERWILARLRDRQFFSLSDANTAVRELLHDMNHRTMRGVGQSRCERFEQTERALLSPLPATPYVYTEIKKVRVHIDSHAEIDKHYYSVPYAHIGQELQAFCTAERVTLKRHQRIVASHPRSFVAGAHTTDTSHLSPSQRAQAEWTPLRFEQWAQKIGVACAQLVAQLIRSKAHPTQAYRVCLGVLALAKKYGDTRLENACARALHLRSLQRRTLVNILEHGLDQQPLHATEQTTLPLHDNVRGAHHYH